jgi:hypothetical protein
MWDDLDEERLGTLTDKQLLTFPRVHNKSTPLAASAVGCRLEYQATCIQQRGRSLTINHVHCKGTGFILAVTLIVR